MRSQTFITDRSQLLPGIVVRTAGCGRCFDIVCAVAGLLVLWPALLLIALVILIFDGPPLLFRQERVGLRGKPFRIWKFRTMTPGLPGADDLLITAAGDPRITKLGRWLRESKLDELPQLLNVLVGEMSVIGPRPEVSRYVQLDAPVWQAALAVRPGITDLATLAYVDEALALAAQRDPEAYYRDTILPRKLGLNVRYLQLRSWRTDLQMILLTAGHVLGLAPRDQGWMQKFLAAE